MSPNKRTQIHMKAYLHISFIEDIKQIQKCELAKTSNEKCF